MPRNRLVRFLAGPPHAPRGKFGSQWFTLYLREFVSYENDYIADLSMQRLGLKLGTRLVQNMFRFSDQFTEAFFGSGGRPCWRDFHKRTHAERVRSDEPSPA